jgi:hypothetical protein
MPIFEYRCRDCGSRFEKISYASKDEILCQFLPFQGRRMKGCRANPDHAPAERPVGECAVNSEEMEMAFGSDFRFPPCSWSYS